MKSQTYPSLNAARGAAHHLVLAGVVLAGLLFGAREAQGGGWQLPGTGIPTQTSSNTTLSVNSGATRVFAESSLIGEWWTTTAAGDTSPWNSVAAVGVNAKALAFHDYSAVSLGSLFAISYSFDKELTNAWLQNVVDGASPSLLLPTNTKIWAGATDLGSPSAGFGAGSLTNLTSNGAIAPPNSAPIAAPSSFSWHQFTVNDGTKTFSLASTNGVSASAFALVFQLPGGSSLPAGNSLDWPSPTSATLTNNTFLTTNIEIGAVTSNANPSFGSPVLTVPEPSGAILIVAAGLFAIMRRRCFR